MQNFSSQEVFAAIIKNAVSLRLLQNPQVSIWQISVSLPNTPNYSNM